MIRTTVKIASKVQFCTDRRIAPGEAYLEHVASPSHESLGNTGWWRIAECADCARRYGRGVLLASLGSS